MTVPVPFYQVEAALLAALADGPQLVCDLAAVIGRPDAHGLVIAEAALRSMRARGLVRREPGPDGLWRWAWVPPPSPRGEP